MPQARKKAAKKTAAENPPVEKVAEKATRETDQEVFDRQTAEKKADRDKHNARRAQFGE